MEKALIEKVKEKLSAQFGDALLSTEMTYDFPVFTIKKENIRAVIKFLYEDEELQFAYLTDLCGIHFPAEKQQLGVVYHLHNLQKNYRIRLKTYTNIQNPQIDSMTPIFSAANWMERETYDFFGIEFTGHPNMTRILNVDYMGGSPMRKEFPLEDPTREDKDDKMFGRE